jgi:hypothetical protein
MIQVYHKKRKWETAISMGQGSLCNPVRFTAEAAGRGESGGKQVHPIHV